MEAFSHSFNTPFMLLFSSLLCSVSSSLFSCWELFLDYGLQAGLVARNGGFVNSSFCLLFLSAVGLAGSGGSWRVGCSALAYGLVDELS